MAALASNADVLAAYESEIADLEELIRLVERRCRADVSDAADKRDGAD
jgi:outer membrane protein TolC